MEKTTNKPGLLYVGTEGGEEYYLNLDDDTARGWSFMGLRPETEESLRAMARERDPEDMFGVSREDFNALSDYFDYDRFADDMEDEWLESHDSQAERYEDGETLYLGFGSGTDIFHYFKEHGIVDYASYVSHFADTGLTERDFNHLIGIVNSRSKKDPFKMTDEEKKAEMQLFRDYFLSTKA